VSFVREKAAEKMATNIFDLSVLILCAWLNILCVWLNILCVWLNILCVWLNIYLSLQKLRISFFYIPGTNVFSTVQFTLPVLFFFSVSSFHGAFEASKAKKKRRSCYR